MGTLPQTEGQKRRFHGLSQDSVGALRRGWPFAIRRLRSTRQHDHFCRRDCSREAVFHHLWVLHGDDFPQALFDGTDVFREPRRAPVPGLLADDRVLRRSCFLVEDPTSRVKHQLRLLVFRSIIPASVFGHALEF
jgi:hypothetical protein